MAYKFDDWEYTKQKLIERWEDFLEDMPDYVSKKSLIIAGSIAGTLLLMVIMISALPESPEEEDLGPIKKEWYYDLNTGKLFKDKAGQVTPIKSPSGAQANGGAAGAKAYVFYRRGDEKERVVGFLEIINTEFFSIETDPNEPETTRYVKGVDDSEWIR